VKARHGRTVIALDRKCNLWEHSMLSSIPAPPHPLLAALGSTSPRRGEVKGAALLVGFQMLGPGHAAGRRSA
jgi:hypothetical protein